MSLTTATAFSADDFVKQYWQWQQGQRSHVKWVPPAPTQKPTESKVADFATTLKSNLQYFARKALFTKPKEGGGLVHLVFNKAQQYLHDKVEDQKRRRGYVRIIVIKGRQQGVSTYVAARFFWQAILGTAITVYILAHEAKASQTLFKKVETFYDNLPQSLRSKEKTRNRQTFEFENLSEYSVGTAGAANTGRSQTAQLLHPSELDFYQNYDDFTSGVMQIVADGQGEVIMETTANGQRWAYVFVNKILQGEETEYEIVFIPWFWQDEYRAKCDEGFERTPEEEDLIALYKDQGLNSNEQLQWRRNKISKLGARLFKQEYPNTLLEAFQASGDSYYDIDFVNKARKSRIKGEKTSALILGCDPGRTGDRTVIVLRRGRKIIKHWVYGGKKKESVMKQTQLAGILKNIIDEYDVDKAFIDVGNGYGTIDILEQDGYGSIVQGVHFGESADQEQFLNKRSEMACNFKDWLENGEVSIPDDEDMAADILAMPEPEITSNSKIKFPLKSQIKKDIGRSPDILDAIMLTFAYKVRPKESQGITNKVVKGKEKRAKGQLGKVMEMRHGRRKAA